MSLAAAETADLFVGGEKEGQRPSFDALHEPSLQSLRWRSWKRRTISWRRG